MAIYSIQVGESYRDGRGRIWKIDAIDGKHRTVDHRCPIVATRWEGKRFSVRLFMRCGGSWPNEISPMDLVEKVA